MNPYSTAPGSEDHVDNEPPSGSGVMEKREGAAAADLETNGRYKFCPRCSNLLVLNTEHWTCMRFECPTCPYYLNVTSNHSYKITIKRAVKKEGEDEDIIDLDKAQKHRQRTQVVCPECTHTEAFFYQMQTRSADEPMTNFYECTNKACKHNWRD